MFFQEKPNFWTYWEILLIQMHSASNWLLLAVSKRTQGLFWKTTFFSRRNQFCQRFETSYYFNCILQQIFNFGDFYKINCFFEKPIYFNFYNQILKVSRSLTFSVEFYRKFATFGSFFLGKSNFSFQKVHHNVPSKNLKFEPFENFHSPNAIVEPICYF